MRSQLTLILYMRDTKARPSIAAIKTKFHREMMGALLPVSFFLLMSTGCRQDHSPEARAQNMTKARIDIFCAAIETYRADHGALPVESIGLEAMIEPAKRSPDNPVLQDGWGHRLLPVVSDGSIVGSYSVGPNGKDERSSGDDVICRIDR